MAKKTKTVIEASASGSKGTIRIVDRIAEYTSSSSYDIRAAVDELLRNAVSEVEVYINSAGGNCFEANEMCNELGRLPKVSIQVGAVCASAATYFLTRFPSIAFPNSQFMVHRPKMGTYGDIDSIESDLKLLRNTEADYRTAYSKKMKKTEGQIDEMWAKGDHWMTAKEAKAEGLLDEILEQSEEVTAESILILEACAAPVIPTASNNQQKQLMERTKLISMLKLPADATDAQIEAALSSLQAKAETATGLEAKAKETLEANVTTLVDGAISEKKITADLKEHYTKLATADFDATKKIIEGMTGVKKLSDDLDNPNPSAEGREKWTFEDYLDKDPEAIKEMMVKNPEMYKKLEAAYHG